jgi:hypothetical protein
MENRGLSLGTILIRRFLTNLLLLNDLLTGLHRTIFSQLFFLYLLDFAHESTKSTHRVVH